VRIVGLAKASGLRSCRLKLDAVFGW